MKILCLMLMILRHVYIRLETNINTRYLMLTISQFTWIWYSFRLISLVFRIVWFVRAYFSFNSVQLLSRVWLFVTPWIAALQASLSITNSRSSLRLTSIESVMPSSHLILCCSLLFLPQSLPASESFPMSQHFTRGGQSTGVSALASFLPKKSHGWSPSEWTGWISLQSKRLSGVFSNTTVQTH